jgi:hypothetical protein
VVKQVEEVSAELGSQPFVDLKLLHNGEVRIEPRRSVEGVPAKVAKYSASRKGEPASGWPSQATQIGAKGYGGRVNLQRRNRREICEVVVDWVNIALYAYIE